MKYTIDEEIYRILIRLLMNYIYDNQVLNIEKLKKLGGISSIIDLYISIHSYEAKENLFVVIFDYVIYSMETKKKVKQI